MRAEILRRRVVVVVLTVGIGSGLLSACGSQPEATSEPSAEVTSSRAESAESASPIPSSQSPSEGTPSVTESPDGATTPASEEPGDDGSERPPVLDKEATGRDLTLSDFFSVPEGWQDGRFDVAGQRGLAGVSGLLSSCRYDQDNHDTLELRLANRFEKISMKIGQSDESEQSDAVLNVRLVGNGKYIDSVKVPFNKVDEFSASVADVNALKIEVWIGGDNCDSGNAVGAVLTGLRLE